MAIVLTHLDLYTGSQHFADGFIRFDKQILASGAMADLTPMADDVVDARYTGMTVVPGFIDTHMHGGYGLDTMDADPAKINALVNFELREGTTTVLPTTMTQSIANVEATLVAVNEAAQNNPRIAGIHLEGPFISHDFPGAQPAEFIIKPDADLLARWYELAGGRIKMVTYAPEEADAAFEQFMVDHDIVASMGHTNATSAQLAGHSMTHVTHLYNAQRGLHHREPGVTGYALLHDTIQGEVIADGLHVVPDMLELAFRLKGPHKLNLVTDSMRAKGLGDGQSELGGQTVWVKDKQARLVDGTLAGSVLTLDEAFANIQKFTTADIQDAVQMSSVNQARELNLPQKGGLEAGKDADFNIFNTELQLQATYSYGELAARD